MLDRHREKVFRFGPIFWSASFRSLCERVLVNSSHPTLLQTKYLGSFLHEFRDQHPAARQICLTYAVQDPLLSAKGDAGLGAERRSIQGFGSGRRVDSPWHCKNVGSLMRQCSGPGN